MTDFPALPVTKNIQVDWWSNPNPPFTSFADLAMTAINSSIINKLYCTGSIGWPINSMPTNIQAITATTVDSRTLLSPENWIITIPTLPSWQNEINTAKSTQPTYAERALSWKNYLINEIENYKYRMEGWDGYNASPINSQAIKDAQEFIQSIPNDTIPPRDQPLSSGDVSLIWRDGDRFAEIGFSGSNTFYWYATDGVQESGDDDVPIPQGIPLTLKNLMWANKIKNKPRTSTSPISYDVVLGLINPSPPTMRYA